MVYIIKINIVLVKCYTSQLIDMLGRQGVQSVCNQLIGESIGSNNGMNQPNGLAVTTGKLSFQ